MPEANLSRGRIYYEVYGEGQALIGLHHGLSSSRTWKSQIQTLGTHYRFFVYDRLGHGRSEHHVSYEREYFENRASELDELIRYLGLDSVHLCGMCEGGAVALLFASAWPKKVKTLILQGVGYFGTDATIAKCEKHFLPWAKLDASLRKQLIYHHGEEYAMAKWEAVREAKYYVWDLSYDLRPRFSDIQVPTLIMGGDRDPFFGLEHPVAAFEGINNAKLCIMPGVGHFLNEEAPALFNTIVLNFLKQHGRTT